MKILVIALTMALTPAPASPSLAVPGLPGRSGGRLRHPHGAGGPHAPRRAPGGSRGGAAQGHRSGPAHRRADGQPRRTRWLRRTVRQGRAGTLQPGDTRAVRRGGLRPARRRRQQPDLLRHLRRGSPLPRRPPRHPRTVRAARRVQPRPHRGLPHAHRPGVRPGRRPERDPGHGRPAQSVGRTADLLLRPVLRHLVRPEVRRTVRPARARHGDRQRRGRQPAAGRTDDREPARARTSSPSSFAGAAPRRHVRCTARTSPRSTPACATGPPAANCTARTPGRGADADGTGQPRRPLRLRPRPPPHGGVLRQPRRPAGSELRHRDPPNPGRPVPGLHRPPGQRRRRGHDGFPRARRRPERPGLADLGPGTHVVRRLAGTGPQPRRAPGIPRRRRRC